jgi:hypothetical protein
MSTYGTSGNTAWHNSVRARMYFEEVKDSPGLRKLVMKKNNYGPSGDIVTLMWKDGVYAPEPKLGSFERVRSHKRLRRCS